MRGYAVMLKHELVGSAKTYKALIMLAVFAIFGLMNPLFAKMMPQIMQLAMPAGTEMSMVEPTAFDSWAQFFKNITQMGMIVVAIVFSGIVCNELSSGTLINLLTKGLSRVSVILAKFTSMVLLWTASWGVCLGITWGYTVFLFPKDSPENVLFSAVCLWVFGVWLLSIIVFASTLAKNSYVGLLVTGSTVALAALLNIPKVFQQYNPMALASLNMALLQGQAAPNDVLPALLVAGLLSVLFVTGAALVFRKKSL